MKKTDISYISDGFWVTFFPENKEAQKNIWEVLADASEGTAKFPVTALPSIKQQIKCAGYSVRKARRKKFSDKELLSDLLA